MDTALGTTDTREVAADRPCGRGALLALQAAVVIQAIGAWRLLVGVGESPLLEWLHCPADIGGWNQPESVALSIQTAAGWAALAAGAWLLWRPHWLPAAGLAAVQWGIAWAQMSTDGGFPVAADWASPAVRRAFPLLTSMARWAAPAGLAWWLVAARRTGESLPRAPAPLATAARWSTAVRRGLALRPIGSLSAERVPTGCCGFLRTAIAVTFAAHGIESIQGNPVFIDLLIDFSGKWGIDLAESTARTWLRGIGHMDLLCAGLCLAVRWRWVLWWMAAWGAATAMSRVAANGWFWWHDVALRAPHVLVPLAIARRRRRVE